MMIKKKILSILVMALCTITGAWAQETNIYGTDVTTEFYASQNYTTSDLLGWTSSGSDNGKLDINTNFIRLYNTGSDNSKMNRAFEKKVEKAFTKGKVYTITFKMAQSNKNNGYFFVQLENITENIDIIRNGASVGGKEWQFKSNRGVADGKTLSTITADDLDECHVSFYVKEENVQPIIGFYHDKGDCNMFFTRLKIYEMDKKELDYGYVIAKAEHVLKSADFFSATGTIRSTLQKYVNEKSTVDVTKITDDYLAGLIKAYNDFRNFRSDFVGEWDWTAATPTKSDASKTYNVEYVGKLTNSQTDVTNRWQTKTPYNVDWEFKPGTGTNKQTPNPENEHWDGKGVTTYINQVDQWPNDENKNVALGYASNNWDFNLNYTTIPLKAGTYVVKFASRRSDNMVAELTTELVNCKENYDAANRHKLPTAGKIASYIEFPITYRDDLLQTEGYGIDIQGHAVHYPHQDHTFCYDGRGRGWAWCHMIFTITEDDIQKYGVAAPGYPQDNTDKVCVRFDLTAAARQYNQYISLGECFLFRVTDDYMNAHTNRKTEVRNTSTGWGTICLPFTSVAPSNTKVYTVKGLNEQENAILFEVSNVLEAGQAYVFRGPANTDITFTEYGVMTGAYMSYPARKNLQGIMSQNYFNEGYDATASTEKLDNATLVAMMLGEKPLGFDKEKSYVLKDAKWHHVSDNFKFTPQRAFLQRKDGLPHYDKDGNELTENTQESNVSQTATPAGRLLWMGFGDDNTSGVDELESEEVVFGTDKAYNINGQRVGAGYKGIVIKNGKKQLVK